MTEHQPEARAVCEHFYASRCYRGMSVRLCMTCHEPDWDDLAGQLAFKPEAPPADPCEPVHFEAWTWTLCTNANESAVELWRDGDHRITIPLSADSCELLMGHQVTLTGVLTGFPGLVTEAEALSDDGEPAQEPAETPDAESPAPVPAEPATASTIAFQARWPVTAPVLRSQVRAAIEHWASGDAGDEDPAGVVMAAVAPFIESLVAEGLRAETDRAEAAEAKLAEVEALCRHQRASAPESVRTPTVAVVRILGIIGSDEKGPGNG